MIKYLNDMFTGLGIKLFANKFLHLQLLHKISFLLATFFCDFVMNFLTLRFLEVLSLILLWDYFFSLLWTKLYFARAISFFSCNCWWDYENFKQKIQIVEYLNFWDIFNRDITSGSITQGNRRSNHYVSPAWLFDAFSI